MILLLSRRLGEASTDAVIDWLEQLGSSYFRLNVEDVEYPSAFELDLDGPGTLRLFDDATGTQRVLHFDQVNVVWYRRWSYFSRYCEKHVDHVFDEPHRQYQLADYFRGELEAVGHAIFAKLAHAHWLSDWHSARIDKFRQLEEAARVGLDVPATAIASTRRGLADFLAAHPQSITKAMGPAGYNTAVGDTTLAAYTSELTDELVQASPERFFPSLVQESVDKRYELRCFVLDGDVYSMAIFSQGDAQTSVDFRRYNETRPNRNIPYKLPDEVETRLLALFDRLGLVTGSADIIRARDGRYVFLEVNPVGQFGMVSIPCNYQLEKKVAAYLSRHDQVR
jgi:ATP-GRASP peptide maturase of grasp-with-spasm system